MEDKFATLEQLFLDRRRLGECLIGTQSFQYWLETSNKRIMAEVLRLAEEFTEAEVEETYAKST